MGLSVVIIGESVRWLASYKAGEKIEREKMAEIWKRNGGKVKKEKELNRRISQRVELRTYCKDGRY